MSKYQRLRQSLPSLYLPELGDESLLNHYLQAVGQSLDEMGSVMQAIMQAHWFDNADQAQLDGFLNRQRQLNALPPLNRLNLDDREVIMAFPYIEDLARLGSLLALPPWQEPAELRETVEAYRLRLQRMVALYKQGLGTVAALRGVTEANLAPDLSAALAAQDRSFSIECTAPLTQFKAAFQTRGQPFHIAGPLMRWHFDNAGLEAVVPTLYVQGVEPQAQIIDATEQPLVERFQTASGQPAIGIAYDGSLAADQVLRLSPASQLWLSSNDLQTAQKSRAAGETEAMASRQWSALAGQPDGTPHSLHFAYDGHLWMVINNADDWQLWRFNGSAWARFFTTDTLSAIHCLTDNGRQLLVGMDDGLFAIDLYPLVSDDYSLVAIASAGSDAVHDITLAKDASYWLATSTAVNVFDQHWNSINSHLSGAVWHCVYQDANGTMFCGGELGAFQYDAGRNHWYWFHGEHVADQFSDWLLLDGALPTASEMFIPPVLAIATSPDQSLWLGTSAGLTRWVAQPVNGFTYTTQLQAYPDLVDQPVHQIQRDPRGLLWFCSERGVMRYDGRDLSHYLDAEQSWAAMGRADSLYDATPAVAARGQWRFNRQLSTPLWQRFERSSGSWINADLTPQLPPQPPIRNVLWSSHAEAQLGSWSSADKQFIATANVDPLLLRLRIKVSDDRPLDGGIAYIPELPVGRSVWRYLALETAADVSSEQPRWTREGRIILPPNQAAAYPGRLANYRLPPDQLELDQQVFAYNPAAMLWLEWQPKQNYSTLVRLTLRPTETAVHPAIIDRVWEGLQRTRPAGIKVALAVEDQIIKES